MEVKIKTLMEIQVNGEFPVDKIIEAVKFPPGFFINSQQLKFGQLDCPAQEQAIFTISGPFNSDEDEGHTIEAYDELAELDGKTFNERRIWDWLQQFAVVVFARTHEPRFDSYGIPPYAMGKNRAIAEINNEFGLAVQEGDEFEFYAEDNGDDCITTIDLKLAICKKQVPEFLALFKK